MANYMKIPQGVANLINMVAGNDSEVVFNSINDILMFESPPLIEEGKTYGDWNVPFLGSAQNGDYRPAEALPLAVIDQMLKSAPVRFALEMKRSQVVSVFRNSRSWKIHSPDEELAEIVTYNLAQILPKMALDFSFSSLAYGTSFQELVWEYKNKYELGITNSKYQGNRKFTCSKIPNSVNPATVLYIKRDADGHFDGFVQQARAGFLSNGDIHVDRASSLLMPYEERFRNLWGESMLKPMYPIWFWYEVVLRSMVKYMERMGTPITVVKAPSKGRVLEPGTRTPVEAIVYGLKIASNASRSSAISIPSDVDDSGKPLWEISYLNATEKSQPFLDILELLTQMILRAGLSADRAISQSSGGVGSFAIGKVHQEATALHNEMILIQWVHYLNTYFLPHYSLYNRGRNGPPIWMETQGLDPTDRENLGTLLGVSQSMESFKDVGYRIDWESLFTVNNIPLLTEEEGKAKKEEQQETALKAQEDMLSVQSKFATPSPTKQKDGSLKANLPNKAAPPKES